MGKSFFEVVLYIFNSSETLLESFYKLKESKELKGSGELRSWAWLLYNHNVVLIYTLVKSSRIYTGQYTFPILLLNDDNMLGEHKGREKNIVYGRLF